MNLTLSDNLRFCRSGDRTIFLDIEKGRYFTIPNTDAEVFGRWHEGKTVDLRDVGQLERLKSQGVIIDAKLHCSSPSSRRVEVEAPKEAWSCRSRKTPLHILALAVSLRLLWSWRVRHCPFKRLVELQHQLATKAALGERPSDKFRLDQIISAFEFSDLLVGSHDRCLERSFALAAACRCQNFNVTVVIGIQGQPFAAHCWVQQGQIVLNEKPDAVGMFSPILAL